MSSFDVWILRFHSTATAPSDGLRRVFGIDEGSAREIEQTLPRVVKHGVHAKAAGEMRKALESIGAIVECRPAKAEASSRRKPVVEPVRRISAVDPVARGPEAGVPRISVDDVAAPPPSTKPDTAEPTLPNSPSESAGSGGSPVVASLDEQLLAASRARQRNRYVGQAAGTIVAGLAIIAMGFVMGNSVFRGEANVVGVGFGGLAIYFLGVGAYDLYATLRS